MSNLNTNPALKELAVLVGKWRMKISNASFLPDLSQTVEASAVIEWLEDGDFLVLRQGDKHNEAGIPWATWLIGHDQDAPNYTVLYLDDRQFSRVYEMTFTDGVWKIWRNAPNFVQSFEGRLSEDKRTITGAWGKSKDGKEWEHDFELVYTRID